MIYSYFVRGQKHATLCQVSMQAVKKADPDAVVVVASDDHQLKVPGAEMVYFKPGLPLMVANLEAQLTVMSITPGPIVFLDTDVLFLKPFFVDQKDDIVVTWRNTVGGVIEDIPGGVADFMPYNFGVVGVNTSLRAIESFIWMRTRIEKMSDNFQQWWGNQIALAALCGPRPETDYATEERKIPWRISAPGPTVRISKLPGSMWNHTPNSEDEDLSERGAVHFKGHTRPWMKSCVERLGFEWMEKADD